MVVPTTLGTPFFCGFIVFFCSDCIVLWVTDGHKNKSPFTVTKVASLVEACRFDRTTIFVDDPPHMLCVSPFGRGERGLRGLIICFTMAVRDTDERSFTECTSTDSRAQIVPSLLPKAVFPLRWSRTSEASLRLDTLLRLLVTDISGQKDMFTLSSFVLPSTSRLPTRQQPLSPPLRRKANKMMKQKPDVCVSRSYADFESLRHEISTMLNQHHPHYCVLCGRLRFLLFVSFSQPTAPMRTLLAFSTGQRAKCLQAFAEDLLLILRRDRPRCVYACTAHKQLPVVLHDVIFQDGAFDYETTASA